MDFSPAKALSPAAVPVRTATTIMPPVFAIAFGIFLVFGTGFAQSTSLHNAAHDTRHALAFPCH